MTVYSAVKAQEATAVMTIISNSNIANKLTITAQLSSLLPQSHRATEPACHLFQPSVVRDIFSLRHPAVDIKVNPREFVLVVLINDTLGLPPELLYGDVVPPLLQVSVFIKLPAPRKDKKLP